MPGGGAQLDVDGRTSVTTVDGAVKEGPRATEDLLRDVLRAVCVSADLTQRRGVDERDTPGHQFRESLIQVLLGEA